MVAVIKTGHSIRHIFNCSEQKVKQGAGKCIAAENYPNDLADLTSISRSISIPPETLPVERLRKIAETYMHGKGFGEQLIGASAS